MPRVNFTFSGYVTGARVNAAFNPNLDIDIDVSDMSDDELAAKLQSGELTIDLSSAITHCKEANVEFDDCEPMQGA